MAENKALRLSDLIAKDAPPPDNSSLMKTMDKIKGRQVTHTTHRPIQSSPDFPLSELLGTVRGMAERQADMEGKLDEILTLLKQPQPKGSKRGNRSK